MAEGAPENSLTAQSLARIRPLHQNHLLLSINMNLTFGKVVGFVDLTKGIRESW